MNLRLSLCLAAVLVTAQAGHRARAAGPAPSAAADLGAERLRLRAELDRVNAEIDALKRSGNDDSRLRARLADAEALARRLVDLERRMGLTAPPAQPAPLPTASPSDGPADLDAKADILADQARRVRAAADALDRRVAELKGRQELRRRAADLDRDPFAPLEGSKRRTVSVATATEPSHSALTPSPPSSSAADGRGLTGIPQGTSAGGGSNTGPVLIISSPTPSGPLSTPGGATLNAAVAPLVVSVELRDLLDPATLADVGRIEGGRAPSSLTGLQRAVSALRARAAKLDGQARAMRQAARKP